MKFFLYISIFFLGACALNKDSAILKSKSAVAHNKIVTVAGYEIAEGDEAEYIKALLGKASYTTENIHGLAIWRYEKYDIELAFDEYDKLKSWTDISYLP